MSLRVEDYNDLLECQHCKKYNNVTGKLIVYGGLGTEVVLTPGQACCNCGKELAYPERSEGNS